MRRLLAALAALTLLAAPPALAGDDPPKDGAAPPPPKEAPKEPPRKEPAAGDPKPAAPAKDAKAAPEPKKAAPAPVATSRSPRSRKEALLMLERITLSVNFDEVPLRDAVQYLSNVTGVNLILGAALLREGQADLMKATLRLTKVSARQVVDLLAQSHGLGIGFQSGVLTLTTVKEARGKPVLRMYLTSDITFALRDFPGPDMDLHPSGFEKPVIEETVTKPAFSEPDDILHLVKDNTGEGTWEDEGVSASVMKEWLVVKQYEEVHEEIGRILALLRANR